MGVERPVLSWLAVALVLVPLPRQWQIKNFAVLSLIAWLFILGLVIATDAVLWMGHARIAHVTWCDITVRILVAGNFGLPSTLLCLSIQLERVTSLRSATIRPRHWRIFEVFLCWIFPLLMVPLHYIYEGHRLDILEDLGCYPPSYINPYTMIHWVIVPFLLSVVSFLFACAALIHFLRQRARFYKYLSDTTPSLRKADYIRLLLLTFVQMIGGVTVTSILLWYDYFVAETRPWKSWANVHSNWGRIAQFPKALFEPQAKRFVYGLSWNVQVSCLCVFIFFTSVSDVVRQCKAAYAWFNLVVLRRRLPEPPAKVRIALKPRAGPLLGTSSTALSPISVDVSKSDYSMDKTKVGSEGEEMSPTATAVDGGVMDIRLPPKVHRRERSRVRGEILP